MHISIPENIMNFGKPVVNEIDRWGLEMDRRDTGVRHACQALLTSLCCKSGRFKEWLMINYTLKYSMGENSGWEGAADYFVSFRASRIPALTGIIPCVCDLYFLLGTAGQIVSRLNATTGYAIISNQILLIMPFLLAAVCRTYSLLLWQIPIWKTNSLYWLI